MDLWPHQVQGRDMLRQAYGNKQKRQILVLPCGGGKTFTACSIVLDAMDKDGSIMILVDRVELLSQWASSLNKWGIDFRFIRSKAYKDTFLPSKVYLGMVESVYSRMKKDPSFLDKRNIQFLIPDECHKFAFFKILAGYNRHVLGLTATPLCSNPKGILNQVYDNIVMPIQTPELILAGHIVKAKTYSIKHDWTGMRRTAKGEFTEASQLLHFNKAKLYDGLVEHWKNYAKDKVTIIYNINVEHSQDTARRFREQGITCEHMDGKMSEEERSAILKRFRSGETQILCNVHLLTTGNDEPHVECIGLNRKVGLISTCEQIRGRGGRSHTFQDGRLKRDFICLDMGANHEKHGVFGERIDWVKIFNDPKLAKDNEGTTRTDSLTCPDCAGVVSSRLDNCVWCKADLSSAKKPKRSFSDAIAASPEKLALIKQQKQDTLPPDLRGLTPGQMSPNQLWRFVEHMGYKKSYYHIMLKKRKR